MLNDKCVVACRRELVVLGSLEWEEEKSICGDTLWKFSFEYILLTQVFTPLVNRGRIHSHSRLIYSNRGRNYSHYVGTPECRTQYQVFIFELKLHLKRCTLGLRSSPRVVWKWYKILTQHPFSDFVTDISIPMLPVPRAWETKVEKSYGLVLFKSKGNLVFEVH